MGFFRRFGKIGIREEIRQKSNICPTDEGIKSKSKAIKGEIPSGQSYVGKCFSAEYKLTTEGCENYGAICHKGLVGNFCVRAVLSKQIAAVHPVCNAAIHAKPIQTCSAIFPAQRQRSLWFQKTSSVLFTSISYLAQIFKKVKIILVD